MFSSDLAIDLGTANTLVYARGTISFWAGGGIVADSRLAGEYQETFDKAAAMLRLLQQTAGMDYVMGDV